MRRFASIWRSRSRRETSSCPTSHQPDVDRPALLLQHPRVRPVDCAYNVAPS
jgi:hypothetical protein